MIEPFKSASAALALAMALGIPMQGVEAAADQSKPTQVAAEPRPAKEKTASKTDEPGPSNGMKTFDALAVRPVTFVTSVFSAGTFVLALPFAALDPALNVEETRKNLVDEPFQDTFQRPLGDFSGSAW